MSYVRGCIIIIIIVVILVVVVVVVIIIITCYALVSINKHDKYQVRIYCFINPLAVEFFRGMKIIF